MRQMEADEVQDGPDVADVYAEPDGTIVLRFHHQTRLTLDHTRGVTRAQIELSRGEKRAVLADVRGLISSDRGSRELAAGPTIAAVTARMAILVGNPLTRLIGNFFLVVSAPAYPTRIFSDEVLARAWLQEDPS